MSKPLTILGISCSHDASACVMRDGRVEVAIQLERLTRKKHDGQGFLHSRLAADYCLDALRLRPSDVDFFAFNSQPLAPGYVGLNVPTHDADFDLFDPFDEKTLFVSHHLAHAFAAYYSSPFGKATVFIADGSGGSTVGCQDLLVTGPTLHQYLSGNVLPAGLHVESTYVFDPASFALSERCTAASFNTRNGSTSLGEVYAAVSQFIFGSWQDSGKLMGLAPYGCAERCGPSFLIRDSCGRLQFSSDWKNNFRQVLRPKDPMEWADLAARIQQDFEDAMVERVRDAVNRTGIRDVAYAGGLALNIHANQRLRHETDVNSLFIMPACNDAGISIGVAAAAHWHATKAMAQAPVERDYLGRFYSANEMDIAIDKHRSRLNIKTAELETIADRLIDGQVIGWFDGNSEFGPRALGHRSILAAPHDRLTWHYINRRVKFREDFRPFAPIVPLECADRFFDISEPSPFMLRAVKVREEYASQLAAVTHVDGSARVQTLTEEQNPRLHQLLTCYGARSGIPVLINTSLNVRGEPIVETPLEAIELLLKTYLDALVLGPHFLSAPDDQILDNSLCLSLAPGVEARLSATLYEKRTVLLASGRDGTEYEIPDWAHFLISRMDGATPLATLLRWLPNDVAPATAIRLLTAFMKMRLLLANSLKE